MFGSDPTNNSHLFLHTPDFGIIGELGGETSRQQGGWPGGEIEGEKAYDV